MFTWSLGCTSSPARLARTSLAFVFDDVPEPVWKTSIGNWSSWRPSATSSPARPMRSPSSASSSPSSAFTRAAAALMRPSQWTTGVGTGSPDTWKLSIALLVSEPQSCGCTSVAMSPRLSPEIGYIWPRFAQGSGPNPCMFCAVDDRRPRSVFSSPSVTALIRIDRSWTSAGAGRPHPIRFCSRCGHPSDEPPGRPTLHRRVCERCGMGMVLSCSRDALPGDAAALPDLHLRAARERR